MESPARRLSSDAGLMLGLMALSPGLEGLDIEHVVLGEGKFELRESGMFGARAGIEPADHDIANVKHVSRLLIDGRVYPYFAYPDIPTLQVGLEDREVLLGQVPICVKAAHRMQGRSQLNFPVRLSARIVDVDGLSLEPDEVNQIRQALARHPTVDINEDATMRQFLSTLGRFPTEPETGRLTNLLVSDVARFTTDSPC